MKRNSKYYVIKFGAMSASLYLLYVFFNISKFQYLFDLVLVQQFFCGLYLKSYANSSLI